jgi:hypothetical protein
MNEAWQNYRREIDDVRNLLLAQPWVNDERSRARVEYALQEMQAATYNHVIAPRPEYPSLYIQTAFQPVIYSCMMHPADFLNRRAFLDGRRTYRIWGKRNGSLFVDFQVINVYYGESGPKKVGNWDLDDFAIKPDGSFEIILSAETYPGNWIRLDASTGDKNFVNIREAFRGLENEKGVEMHIERIDTLPTQPIEFDESALIERLERAGRFFRFALDGWAVKLNKDILENAGRNVFFERSFAVDQGAGNNPSAIYPTAMFHIAQDEALILESEIPNAQFWSVQLGDICWRVLDYAYHNTSLNGFQAKLDSDGRFRCVVAHSDPGVANWLDTLGNTDGIIIFRFYRFDRPVTPTIRKVKLRELRDHLPADTPSISATERAEKLRARTRAVRARYGE